MRIPKNNIIDIFRANLSFNHEDKLNILDISEQKIFFRMRDSDRARHFVLTRIFLKSVLGLYLQKSPSEIGLQLTPHGKPHLPNNELQFNLSHSGSSAAIVISNKSSVGIDIEMIKPIYSEKVAQRFFHPEEQSWIATLPNNEKSLAFYRIWSLKEAVTKALGEKISSLPLSSFSVINSPVSVQNKLVYHAHISLISGYQAAIAHLNTISHITCWEWSPQGISSLNDISLLP